MKRNEANMAARYEHEIPEGYEARIEGNKVIIELKESEDERMINWLIIQLKTNYKGIYWANKAIAYLEKQKELDKMIIVSPEVWDNAIADAYENGKKDGEKQKPSAWSEEDIKKIRSEEYKKGFNDATSVCKPKEWSE